jgi:uncharacterized membrane protein
MRYQILTLAAVTALAAFLRLYGLGDRCLWLDEALSWRQSQFDLRELWSRSSNPFEPENPPLYFALLHLWVKVFGDSELALRLPAALAGIASVPALFLLVRELARLRLPRGAAPECGGWAGVAAAGLLTLSELQVDAARQARMYSLGTLLFLLSSWALLRATRPDARLGWWVLYGLLALAFLYTHNLAMFSVAAQGAFAAVILIARRWGAAKASAKRQANWQLAAGVLTGVVLVGAFAPELQILWTRSRETQRFNKWLGPLSFAQAGRQSVQAFTSSDFAAQVEGSKVGLALVLGAGCAVVLVTLRTGWAGVFVTFTVVVPIVLLAVYSARSGTSLFMPRYLTFAQVCWLAALPLAAIWLPRRVTIGVVVLGAVGWLACSWPCLSAMVRRDASPGMRAAGDLIRGRLAPDELVLTQRVWTQLKLAHALRGWCRPREVALIPSRELHGALYLWTDEVVSPDVLAGEGVAGFWLVSSTSYGEKEGVHFPLPGRWQRTDIRLFAQDYPWERAIVAEHYRRE